MWMGATYSLELLKANLEFTHNGAFAHKSLIDFFTSGFKFNSLLVDENDREYLQERAVRYEDEFLHIDIVDVWTLLNKYLPEHF